MVGEGVRESYVFPSALGWMTGVWRGEELVDFWFGQPTREAALKLLRSDVGAVTVLDNDNFDKDALPPMPAHRLAAIRRLRAYAAGEVDELLDIAIDISRLTPFRRQVTEACRAIPYGETRTYAELAAEVGAPRAARAVGNVMRTNRWPLIVPCHRVVGSAGGLGGYSAPEGLTMKKRLLALESRAAAATV